MSDVLLSALVVCATAIVMVGLALLAVRTRRRGSAGPAIGAAMAAYDEAMHATAYDTFTELQAQQERTISVPGRAPGDGTGTH